MISYDMIRRVTLTQTCTTAALVPRAVCSCIALSCVVKKLRTAPYRRENKNVPSRAVKEKIVPSLPVVEEIIYRPVPS